MLPTDAKLDLFARALGGGADGGPCNVDELSHPITVEGLERVFFQDLALEVGGEELADVVATEAECGLLCVFVCVFVCK